MGCVQSEHANRIMSHKRVSNSSFRTQQEQFKYTKYGLEQQIGKIQSQIKQNELKLKESNKKLKEILILKNNGYPDQIKENWQLNNNTTLTLQLKALNKLHEHKFGQMSNLKQLNLLSRFQSDQRLEYEGILNNLEEEKKNNENSRQDRINIDKNIQLLARNNVLRQKKEMIKNKFQNNEINTNKIKAVNNSQKKQLPNYPNQEPLYQNYFRVSPKVTPIEVDTVNYKNDNIYAYQQQSNDSLERSKRIKKIRDRSDNVNHSPESNKEENDCEVARKKNEIPTNQDDCKHCNQKQSSISYPGFSHIN